MGPPLGSRVFSEGFRIVDALESGGLKCGGRASSRPVHGIALYLYKSQNQSQPLFPWLPGPIPKKSYTPPKYYSTTTRPGFFESSN